MAKYKATGCARFLFFLIIFVPIAYFGSKYLMDSGKWDDIKGKLEDVSSSDNDNNSGIGSPSTFDYNRSEKSDDSLNEKFDQLIEKVNDQADKISEQEETIHRQNVLIDQLKQQLEQRTTNTPSSNNNPRSTPQQNDPNKTSLQDLLKEADKALKNG